MSKIQVNDIVNHFDNGAPDCPRGLTIAGVSTISDALVIGGTDSTAKLNVFGGDIQIGTGLTFKSSSSTGNLNLQGGFTYPGGWIKLSGGSSDDNIVFGTSGNNATKEERLRITSAGNVGIGTDTPGALLSLESTAPNAARLRIGFDSPRYYDIFRGSTTNSGYLNFYGSQSSFTGYIFDGVDGERLRIDSSGRLLKSGQAALTSTSLNHPIQVAAASDANAIAIIGRAADDIAELSFYEADKSTKLGEVQYRQDHANIRHRVGDIRFATGGTTERLRILSTGGITFNGDTATANALDDYEEGTWTPNIGGTATYTTQQGTYTKIGDLVTVTFYVVVSTVGTGNQARIQGLPFTSSSSTGGGPISYWQNLSRNVAYVSAYTYASTHLDFYTNDTFSSQITYQSIITSGSALQGCISYKV